MAEQAYYFEWDGWNHELKKRAFTSADSDIQWDDEIIPGLVSASLVAHDNDNIHALQMFFEYYQEKSKEYIALAQKYLSSMKAINKQLKKEISQRKHGV